MRFEVILRFLLRLSIAEFLVVQNLSILQAIFNCIGNLGKLDNYEQKLKRLKTFYTKALNEVGWNKYSRISVEFSNQVICTKK